MGKRTLFLTAALALFAAAPAAAQDCAGADRKYCILKANLKRMPALESFLGGSDELTRRFAAAAFDSGYKHEWLLFNSLLAGGRKDPGGSLIRSEIAKLPPEQWYYVIRVEDHRRILVSMGGGIYGNFTEGLGNMVRPEKDRMRTMKCFEQADTLIRNTAPVKDTGRPRGIFNAWSALPVTARFRRLSEHTAPCFHFEGRNGPVEIVADSWADTLLPARAWWENNDPDALRELSSGRGVCGPAYDEWDTRRIRALIDKEDKAAEQRKRQLDRLKQFIGVR